MDIIILEVLINNFASIDNDLGVFLLSIGLSFIQGKCYELIW